MKKSLFTLLPLLVLVSSCHVGRFVYWNTADVKDQYKFKNDPISTGDRHFSFGTIDTSKTKLKIPKRLKINGEWTRFDDALRDNKTTAFLIIRKDSILYERYFYDYKESTPHPSFSVAKSFVSALIGIAIEEGKIKSSDEPITNYLTDFKHEGFENITIQHLLDMRSGIAFSEGYYNPFGDVAKFYYGKSLNKYVNNLKVESAPDLNFNYISGNSQLLGAILEKATGKPLAQYLEEKIWIPLEMEYDASWSVDSRKHGTAKAFCCLNARARDFAKFGRLYLNNGNWNGRQIVPAAWVEKTAHSSAANNFRYGNHWWHLPDYEALSDSTDLSVTHRIYEVERDDQKVKMVVKAGKGYMAEGILGQYIYINPEKEVIIVRLGKKNGKTLGGSWPGIFEQLADLY